jgi:AcrR family transcriptional regulator
VVRVPSARERILEATYACGARYGLTKTTVEDVAREAGLARATVYRHFPGGKDELIRETISWEVARFFGRLADAVAGAGTFEALVEEALLFAHAAIEEHVVLQKILETEPERLLPQLHLDTARVRGWITAFIVPVLPADRLPDGVTVNEAADYVSRMVLSFIGTQGRWDLRDRAQVRELVQTEILAFLRPE